MYKLPLLLGILLLFLVACIEPSESAKSRSPLIPRAEVSALDLPPPADPTPTPDLSSPTPTPVPAPLPIDFRTTLSEIEHLLWLSGELYIEGQLIPAPTMTPTPTPTPPFVVAGRFTHLVEKSDLLNCELATKDLEEILLVSVAVEDTALRLNS